MQTHSYITITRADCSYVATCGNPSQSPRLLLQQFWFYLKASFGSKLSQGFNLRAPPDYYYYSFRIFNLKVFLLSKSYRSLGVIPIWKILFAKMGGVFFLLYMDQYLISQLFQLVQEHSSKINPPYARMIPRRW